jgi:hypothetical protein
LTSRGSEVDLATVKKIFPKYKMHKSLQRSSSPCDVLIGLDNYILHPTKVLHKKNNLRIESGLLGHTLIGCLEKEGEYIQNNFISSYLITRTQQERWDGFIRGEDLGVQVSPKCGNCLCRKCPINGHTYSFQEEKELAIIRSGLTFKEGHDGKPGRWFCRCPWIQDPKYLPENKYIALATLKSTERSLDREKQRQVYQDQIEELKQRGVCRKLSEKEDENWQGPKYYICHLAVRSKSVSTPVRICFNSSQSCKGTSLNDHLAKGPDAYMNCLLSVLLRWREYPGVIMGDISKMFYSIGLEEGVDQQTHRFLWRDKPEEEPTTYIMTALSMGDTFSPVAAMEALFQTGERCSDTDKEVAYILQKSSYVDDLVHSTLENPLVLARKVDNCLKQHGFSIKEWQFQNEESGRTHLYEKTCEKTGEQSSLFKQGTRGTVKVLGLNWAPKTDEILFKTELNFSTKKKGQRTEPDLEKGKLKENLPSTLTKRICLEQTAKVYDPLGLLGPHTLMAKILLRKVWQLQLGWDDPIPPDLRKQWVDHFYNSFELDEISFPRCVRPQGTKGKLKRTSIRTI